MHHVRTARDQVESVLDANERLGKLAVQCSEISKAAYEALSKEASRLAECTTSIELASTESVKLIQGQASEAQKTVTTSVSVVTENVASEASRLAEMAKEMERTSVESANLIKKMTSRTQLSFEKSIEATIGSFSSHITGVSEQVIADLNLGLVEARHDLEFAAKSLNEAVQGVDKSRAAILEAHENMLERNQQQIEETGVLLKAAQKLLTEIDARVSVLTGADFENLRDDVARIKKMEEDNSSVLQRQMKSAIVLVDICVIVCIAVLMKLLFG